MELLLFLISIGGGFLGALLGIGGGMIVVPFLTLALHVDIRYAIPASLIAIVATSSGAAASFLKDHLTNLRLAVLLEVGTVTGAITGFLIASFIKTSSLYLLFAFFLLFSAGSMFRKKGDSRAEFNHPWAEKLRLSTPEYKVANVPVGLIAMYFAGILSALLGIGSGIFKMMAMDGAMKMPIKASSATSNFMIGVTATASAGAYLIKGDIHPTIACPVSVGIIVGSYLGAKVMPKVPADVLRKIFVVLLLVVAIQMILKGLRS